MPVETRGEAEAVHARFEATVLPHLDGVFRLAMWLIRERAEAEDVVQETFSQAMQSFHRFEPGTNVRAWLLAIMRHVRANRQRAQRRSPIDTGVDDFVERAQAVEQTPQHVTEGEVLAALAQLPAGFQEVVLLADVEDLSYREIATVLSIPVGTVMSRLHRARRLLRTALAAYAESQGIGRRGAREQAPERPQGDCP
ncbi:MAG: sigma-70 family RNA polymerase sigma factor [Acidobacteria bacterium]|nr:sigma-70 family RNA polymerase sigma factor [Acidobacteriota bacterium]